MANNIHKNIRKPFKYWKLVIKLFYRRSPTYIRRFFSQTSCRIVIEIIGIFFILSFGFDNNVRFNLFQFDNQTAGIEILSVVASALSAIFGIALAFIVLSIENSKTLFAWHTYKKIFSIDYMRELASLYISSIVFAVVSLLTFSSASGSVGPITSRLIIGAIYLFVLSMVALIPYIQKILEASEGQKSIVDLVKSIRGSDIRGMSRLDLPYTSSSSLKDNAVYIAANVARQVIKTENDLAARWLIEAVVETFSEKLEEYKKLTSSRPGVVFGDNDRGIVNSFAYIIKEMANSAIKHQNISKFSECIEAFRYMSDICAENNLKWPAFNELYEMANKSMARAIGAKFDDVIGSASAQYMRIPVQQWLLNAPKEEDIWDFNHDTKTDDDHINSLHWQHISNDFLYGVGKLTDKAITVKNKGALRSLISDLRFLIHQVDNNKALGDEQKSHLLSHIAWLIRNPIENAIKRDLLDDDDLSFLMPYDQVGMIRSTINKSELRFFKDMTDLMILGAKHNLLSTYSMNNLGAVGRGFVEAVNTNTEAAKALNYIIYIFDELRKIYAKNLGKDERAAVWYLETYSQMESFQRWQSSKKLRNKKLAALLVKKLKLFTKRRQATSLTANSTWDKLFKSRG
jgi:hypothetical protein